MVQRSPEGVAQLQDVQLLGEADAVADVQTRREVAAEYQGGLVGEVRFDADVLDADLANRSAARGWRRPARRPCGGAVLAVLRGRSEGAAGEQQREDLRLRQRRIREEGNTRLAQAAAHVDSRGHVRKHLDGAHIDAGIVDDAAVEDEPAALDVELAAVGRVLAVLDRELAGAAGDGVVSAPMAMLPVRRPSARGVDAHVVAEGECDVARHLEALGRMVRVLPTMTSSAEARTAP